MIQPYGADNEDVAQTNFGSYHFLMAFLSWGFFYGCLGWRMALVAEAIDDSPLPAKSMDDMECDLKQCRYLEIKWDTSGLEKMGERER